MENRSTVLTVLTPGGRAVHVMLAVFVDGDFIYRPFDSADLRDHDGCASFGECAYRLDPPDGAVESLVAAAVADIRSDLQQMDVQATGPRPTAIGLMRAAGWRLVVDDGEYPARSMLKAAGLPVEGPATLAARWIKYVGSAQTQIVAVEGDAAFRDDLERCRTAAG